MPFSHEQAIALSLVIDRRLTYREAAVRMGRTPAQMRQLLRDALSGAWQLMVEPDRARRRRNGDAELLAD